MIFLVTGDINEGKTTYMRSLYKELGDGDGFICPKVMENGILICYDVERLSSGERMPFAVPVDRVPKDWDEQCRFGNYSFSSGAIRKAEQIIDKIIEDKTEPFFIDEVGPLELENHQGFYHLVEKIIASGLDGFIVVRQQMTDKFIDLFKTESIKFLPINMKNKT